MKAGAEEHACKLADVSRPVERHQCLLRVLRERHAPARRRGLPCEPIKEMLRLVRDKKWNIPASIELEYSIPEGSDAVKETMKCVQYCKDALMA